ncbi:conglutin beta 1-like [Prosopis cineraria]|uniref:conglutin beta 1-like n=1 Tax=Prosopis cineraria TaxID=364024 RepID=UPI00240F3F9E|nr:conglutin beta 1-like [Prosopis cineraria]
MAKLPLLMLFLGSVFLAMVSDSVGHSLREDEDQRSRNQNPYLFRSKSFQTRYENERGRIRILPRFDQRSNHLRGLRNYRLVEYELKPHSLFLPHHRDAEVLLVAVEGKAITSIVNQTNRETFKIEEGDVVKVPAGSLVYTANLEENQRFRAASLVLPVNIPGNYENWYPAGNQNPQSYYQAFSRKTLEATFDENINEIRRILFGNRQQGGQGQEQSSNEGVIVRLSREHARELRRHAESSSSPRRRRRNPIMNLKNLHARYSNEYGNLWEACPEEFHQLRDLDISVGWLELKRGSLFLPHYNSRAIVLAQIIDGMAKVEIQQRQQQQQQEEEEQSQSEGHIQRVSSRLNQGDAYVALAGHPLALRASKRNDVRMIAFLLNAENNQRNFLGGERDNVINEIPRVVKERAFPGSGEEVERLIKNQKKSYFVNAQRRQQRGDEEGDEERAPLSSILDEDAFF